MYLFGGVDVAQERFADLIEFNFTTNEMKVVVCGGNAPSARTFHRAEQVNEYMYILGGFDGEKKNDVYRINLETIQSSQNGVLLRSRSGPDQQVKDSKISLDESYKEFIGLIDGYKNSHLNGITDSKQANRWLAIFPQNNYTPRTGHTATILGKEIYMFGGFEANGIKSNQILVYNIDSNSWNPVQAIGNALTPRSGSKSIGYMDQETKILVFFGGYSTGKSHNSENEYYNDLFVFDCLQSKWLQLNTGKDQVPEGRTDHCLVEYQNFLYIFAGKGKSKSLLADFWRFNLENKKWLEIQAEGAQLRPRFGHSAVVYEDSMYVFGGWDGNVCLDELYQYSFPTNIWYDLRRVPGEKPSPRYRHDSLIINGIMYVFGGVDVSQTRYNDLFQLNIASRTWSKIITNGCVPTPRSFHRIVNFHNCIFLLGGLDGERKNDLYLIALNTSTRPISRPSTARKTLPDQDANEKPLASAIYGSLHEQAEKEQPVSTNQMIIDNLNRQVVELSQMLRKEEERNLCKICFSREIDAVFLECCHFVSCYDCAKSLEQCAICRSKVQSVVRTYSS